MHHLKSHCQNGSRNGTPDRLLETGMSDIAKCSGMQPGCCTKPKMLTECEQELTMQETGNT